MAPTAGPLARSARLWAIARASGTLGPSLLLAGCGAIFALAILQPGPLRHVFAQSTYLTLHTFVEVLSSVVCFSIFAVQWHAASARELHEPRALFLGATFLAVGVIGVMHALAFPGMPGFFGPSSTEHGIIYWLASRLCGTFGLLLAVALPWRRSGAEPRRWPFLALAASAALAPWLFETLQADDHALFFIEGRGLTPLKIGLEYLIIAGSLVAAGLWLHAFRRARERPFFGLACALTIGVLSELSFTLYTQAQDAFNLLGHAFNALSYYLVFDALFVAALLRPYARLDATARELRGSNEELRRLRAHIEGELAQTIARLEAVIGSIPEATLVYASDGTIRQANDAARRLFDYTAEEQGAPIEARLARLDLRTPDGLPLGWDANPLVRALRGETTTGQVLSLRPRAQRVWASASAAPIRADDGSLLGAVLALADLTPLYELQEQREDLLRAVSHDLRTPLTSVQLQAQRLRRSLEQMGGAGASELRAVDAIVTGTRRMTSMISDLVDSARLSSGQLKLERQPIELGGFVADVLWRMGAALDVSRITVRMPEGLPSAAGDPARVERVLANLLSNAFKYSAPGSAVELEAALSEGELRLSVRDQGPGIAPENLPKLFERFFRVHEMKSVEGLGLGLYITRLLVEAQGGRIWVESKPGEGSVFSFTLPLWRRETDAAAS